MTQQNLAVLIFRASWCTDCHFLDVFMDDLEKEYANSLLLAELDSDEFPELVQELNIRGIPSFLAFRNGSEILRFVSKQRKTREEIARFLERTVQVAAEL